MTEGIVTTAVIVSYNGGPDTLRVVNALVEQVSEIVVVDNGSEEDSLRLLAAEAEAGTLILVPFGENRGVAHALNAGLAIAHERKSDWILTMDQDSLPSGSMVADLLNSALESGASSVTPQRGGSPGTLEAVSYAITSGNLVSVTAAMHVGGYDDQLFIDGVDFDFSLRLRDAGYRIIRSDHATMQHTVGETVKLPMVLRRFYSKHSAERRYYIARNFLYVARRHLLRHPMFVTRLATLHLVQLLLAPFFDAHPLQGLRASWVGVCDYLRGVSGRRPR